MNRLRFIGPILLLLSLTLSSCSCYREVKVSESEARILGQDALARFCSRKKLPLQAFSLSKIGPEVDLQWSLIYVSSGIAPTHEVVVMINKKGAVETSWGTNP
ncbi:MAG: hypothetical protein HY924_05895 [Elusimicrobia bacterium]|nr:hypothetical protein [Elusimicrobiota bacterium]